MLSQSERWIQFHEMNLKSDPEDAPLIPLSDLLPALAKRVEKKESVKLLNNETASIRIAEIFHDKDKAAVVLLLQYADKNVTDPVFADLKKGRLRLEQKLEGEGIAVSAHVVLSDKPKKNKAPFYHFLLEEVPGLGRSRIDGFIRSELKQCAKGMYEYEDEEQRKKKYSPSAEVLGLAAIPLSKELDDGCVLSSIELVRFAKKSDGIDEESYYDVGEYTLKITPTVKGKKDVKKLLEQIKIKAQKEDYDTVKVRYKHPKGKQKTATMNSTVQDVADTLVLKTEVVRADATLQQCAETIVDDMKKGMIDLLVRYQK